MSWWFNACTRPHKFSPHFLVWNLWYPFALVSSKSSFTSIFILWNHFTNKTIEFFKLLQYVNATHVFEFWIRHRVFGTCYDLLAPFLLSLQFLIKRVSPGIVSITPFSFRLLVIGWSGWSRRWTRRRSWIRVCKIRNCDSGSYLWNHRAQLPFKWSRENLCAVWEARGDNQGTSWPWW